MTSNVVQDLKAKKVARRLGNSQQQNKQSYKKRKLVELLVTGVREISKGPAKRQEQNWILFRTKKRQTYRKFPRPEVIDYENIEIWTIDIDYVDKLTKYNNDVKSLQVVVDVLSRFLRVLPMRSRSAPEAAKIFEKMIEKLQPQKDW